mmetsp:Transcript_21687/g.42608  ORF Transcript_21687/g.42608 Transcript_21687/m.42608 type:complete len:1054 (-) Transcript_21687:82-3243(-)
MAPAKKDSSGKGKAKLKAAEHNLGNLSDAEKEFNLQVPRGDLRIRFPKVVVSPENDEQGIWFRWRLAAIELPEEEGFENIKSKVQSAGCTEIIECTSGEFGFQGEIMGVPVCPKFTNLLLQESQDGARYKVVVEAFLGEYGNADEDKLVGKSSVDLAPLIADAMNSLRLDLRLCQLGEESQSSPEQLTSLLLGIEIEASEPLKDFWANGALFSCENLKLHNVPDEWKTLFSSPENPVKAKVDLDTITILHGQVSQVPEDSKTTANNSTNSNDQEKESMDAAVPVKSGEETEIKEGEPESIWTISAGAMFGPSVFVPSSVLESLMESHELTLDFVVESEPSADATLTLRGRSDADVSGLLVQNVTKSSLQSQLSIPRMPIPQSDEANHIDNSHETIKTQASGQGPPFVCLMTMDMCLGRPLVASPPEPRPVLPRVRDLIQGRPPRRMRAPSAIEMIDEAAENIIDRVTNVYASAATEEQDRVQLLHSLNINGHYQVMRNSLKEALSKFVTTERDGEFAGLQGDALYSAVYEKGLALLNQTFNDKIEAAKRGQNTLKDKPTPARRASELQHRLANLLTRAKDFEAQGLYEEAEELYQERVGDAEKTSLMDNEQDLPVDPLVWFQYATFCLRRGQSYRAAAAECLQSALALDDQHTPSLIAYGALLLESGSAAQAETFLAQALAGDPSVQAIGADFFATAHGLLKLIPERLAASQPPANFVGACLDWQIAEDEDKTCLALYTHACARCLSWNLSRMAAQLLKARTHVFTLAKARLSNEDISAIRFTNKILEGWLESNEEKLEDALEICDFSPTGFMLLAQVMTSKNELHPGSSSSRELHRLALEQAFGRLTSPEKFPLAENILFWHITIDDALVQRSVLELGKIYLEEKAAGAAKRVFLYACSRWPSPLGWMGAGEACMLGEAYTDAIDALAEANLMDQSSPRIWGLLSLACLRSGMLELGQISFKYTKELRDTNLLGDLGTQFLELGDLARASEALHQKMAIDSSQDPALAQTLLLQNRFEEAKVLLNSMQTDEHAQLNDLLRKLVVQDCRLESA